MNAYKGPSLQRYGTPLHLVRAFERELGSKFLLDVCAEEWSAKAPVWIGLPQDGLSSDWSSLNFCNPPYESQALWLQRSAWWAENEGATTVCLPRGSFDARYWQRLVRARATMDIFIGRINFIAPPEGVWIGEKKPRFIPGGEPVPGTTFMSAAVWYGPDYAPGVVRWRDAETGELIDNHRARDLREEEVANV